MDDLVFEKLFNEFISKKENQYLSDKSTAYYWYLKGKGKYDK